MRLWIASLYFYAFVFILCEILRIITRKLLEERPIAWQHHKLFVALIYEFIGTLQVCIPMFDVNFVLDNYGLSGVFFEICFIEFLNAFLLRNALADPCSLFYNYAKGRQTIKLFSLFLAVQFTAGYSSFFIARQFFALGIHHQHQNALQQECSADLTVAIIYGSIVEALGLFAGKMAEHWIDETVLNSNHINLALSIISAFITVLGINLTGMYANPIVAWALTFNCGDVPHFAHFTVYWLAPLSAFFLSKMLLGDGGDEEKIVNENGKKLE